jgi:hypothetical protein
VWLIKKYVFITELHKFREHFSGPMWSPSFGFSVQIFVCISHAHTCATWPTHITLIELIHLLHHIQTDIIWRTMYSKLPRWIMKTKQAWHKMFSFLCYEKWQITKFLSAHTSTKHSPCFLSQQEIFLQLSVAEFLAFLLQENAESFVTLKLFLMTHNVLWVANGFTRILGI